MNFHFLSFFSNQGFPPGWSCIQWFLSKALVDELWEHWLHQSRGGYEGPSGFSPDSVHIIHLGNYTHQHCYGYTKWWHHRSWTHKRMTSPSSGKPILEAGSEVRETGSLDSGQQTHVLLCYWAINKIYLNGNYKPSVIYQQTEEVGITFWRLALATSYNGQHRSHSPLLKGALQPKSLSVSHHDKNKPI